MKKKIALVLSIVSMIFVLGACGTDPKDVDYNGHSYDELQEEIVGIVPIEAKLYESVLAYSAQTQKSIDEIIAETKKEANSSESIPVYYLDGVSKWASTVDEIGSYKGLDKDSFTVDKTGKTLTTSISLEFEDRTATFQIVYSYYNMEITGIVLNPDYTLGEKMKKAGMNTLISMSIVFTVLILISLIIACFNIFPYLEKKKKAKKEADTSKDQVVTQIEQREQQVSDDTELIAVIAAAIAASSGQSTSDFVVRSINRR